MSVTGAQSAERYRCACQRVFQVFGLGHHRRYYDVADVGWRDPVMTRICPSCQRQLPGKDARVRGQ